MLFMAAHYLGGYIRYDESKREWLKYRMEKWDRNIHAVTKMVGKYSQEDYAAVVCVIDLEWIFLQFMKTYAGQHLRERKSSVGNLFDFSFLWKIENPTSC